MSGERRRGGWSAKKNLACLIVFALYITAMFALRLRPLHLICPATDAFLLGWAALLPVLLAIKIIKATKGRRRWEKEEKEKWMS